MKLTQRKLNIPQICYYSSHPLIIPESVLGTPAKARGEKQTSEHRVSVCFFTNTLATIVLSPGERDNVVIRR